MNDIILKIIMRLNFVSMIIFICLESSVMSAQTSKENTSLFTINANLPVQQPETGYLDMGSSNSAKSPDGQELTVNNRYLMLNGKPWLPVMGEFHFSRYPEKYWKEEILKMKAGGIKIISTYIFWIHHEEIEGQFDWSGQHNLRKFVELCGENGLYVYPRIGPWAHGEARNGGFPDWLIEKCSQIRVNDSTYLYYVGKFYDEIGRQLKGLLWKDGGPVVGIQLENEYSNRDHKGGSAHISKLKGLAMEAGLDLPLYTITGWDNAVIPPHIVIPVFGGYPDEPWAGSIKELAPDKQRVYQFHVKTPTGTAGIMQGLISNPENVQPAHYPKFTAELGGGMEDTYHRRVVISGDDIASMALTAVGSGVNLLGYYMFHGGTNPEGKLTTLQESQATGYPNDVPVKSYDFQAPLRESGQMNDSFRRLKVIHQFISCFGSELAQMNSVLPDIIPSGPGDTTTLRMAARVKKNSGFIFFNNYLRNYPLPEHKGIRVTLKLQSENITLPREPVDIPPQSYFFWPVNMNLNGANLKYATAQPLSKIDVGDTAYYFFTASSGIKPEFVFDESSVKYIRSVSGNVTHSGKQIYISGIEPSTNVAVESKTLNGKDIRIILLSIRQAYNSWSISIEGTDYLLITKADVFSGKKIINLRSCDPDALTFLSFPPMEDKFISQEAVKKNGEEGIFDNYTLNIKIQKIPLEVKLIRNPVPVPPVKMGPFFSWRNCSVAMAPDDAVFENAGIWQINLPDTIPADISDIYLNINYSGDIARLYSGAHLQDDNFYNGETWVIGLKRYSPDVIAEGIKLMILPLRKDAPVYLPVSSRLSFNGQPDIAKVNEITASPEYEVILKFK